MKQKGKRKRSIRWYQVLRALLPIIYGGLIFLGIVGQSFIVVAVLMAVAPAPSAAATRPEAG